MNIILKSRQNGFAILESLIAFLLLGISVAALVYLLGNLMSGSSTSKASAEAMELAKDRTEVLRNYTEKSEFEDALYSAVQKEPGTPIQGVNSEYTVSYELNGNVITKTSLIADAKLSTTEPERITVEVRWDSSKVDSNGPVEEKVTLETMLYYMSPAIVSGIESGDEGVDDNFPLLSPLITGVEGEDRNPPPSTGNDETPDVLLDGAGDVHTTLTIKAYYNDVDGVKSYSNVEVIGVDGKVKLTSFGGIVHKLQGDITIGSGANTTLGILTEDLKILASPPSYCVFPICDGGDCTGKVSAKYVCYVPGDCTYGSSDEAKTDPETTCPANFTPPVDDDFEDLNGGWYGRVGNFGVAIHPDDKVCTYETDKEDILTPSRSYVKYRCKVGTTLVGGKCSDDDTDESNGNGNIIANEGTNRPYSNQDFFIAPKNGPNSNCSLLATSRIEGFPLLGEKNFNRKANGDLIDDTWQKNVVLPVNDCSSLDALDGSCL